MKIFEGVGGQSVNSDEGYKEFLFGLTLHLGKASNNYAEYAGVILS